MKSAKGTSAVRLIIGLNHLVAPQLARFLGAKAWRRTFATFADGSQTLRSKLSEFDFVVS